MAVDKQPRLLPADAVLRVGYYMYLFFSHIDVFVSPIHHEKHWASHGWETWITEHISKRRMSHISVSQSWRLAYYKSDIRARDRFARSWQCHSCNCVPCTFLLVEETSPWVGTSIHSNSRSNGRGHRDSFCSQGWEGERQIRIHPRQGFSILVFYSGSFRCQVIQCPKTNGFMNIQC